MKFMKSFLAILLVFGLFNGTMVHAEESNVSFEGEEKGFVFTADGKEVTDLFRDFKNCMPGDELTQEVVVKNTSEDTVKIWLRAVAHDDEKSPLSPEVAETEKDTATMEEFLKQLKMEVKNGEETIYGETTPDQTEKLTENVLLGQFAPGEETTLTVTLKVPAELGNEYAFRKGEVDWIFTSVKLIDVKVTKAWDDDQNRDGFRPEEVTVHLLKDGEDTGSSVTLTADKEWTDTFKDLEQSDAEHDYVYTVKEDVPKEYTEKYDKLDDDGYEWLITNHHDSELIEKITVRKEWNDDQNRDGKRPESVHVVLLGNGETVREADLNERNEWTAVFENVYLRENGKEIEYTVNETGKLDGYELESIEGDKEKGFVITNKHVSDTSVEIRGQKTWDDANNQDGIRPESIEVTLLGNGKEVAKKTVTAKDNWSYEWKDLYRYEEGKEIKYEVTEKAVEGYETKIDGYNITNTHEPETVDITIDVKWQDEDNKDGFRPDEVTVTITDGDGNVVKEVTIGKDDDWHTVVEDLPKYKDGKEIVYIVNGHAVKEYSKMQSGDMNKGFVITYVHIPQTGVIGENISGWIFAGAGAALVIILLLILLKRKENEEA